MNQRANPFKPLAESERFQSFILGLIVLNALVMGLETVPELVDYYDTWFYIFFIVSQAIFGVEIFIRLAAFLPKPSRFFGDGWNVFDFTVVALSFTPAVGSLALLARLARILRVARILSVSDELREFLNGMQASAKIMVRAILVTAVIFYVFSVSGFYLFSETDPVRWGSLLSAFRSLLYVALLQDIPAILEGLTQDGLSALFFVVIFVLILLVLLLNVIAATTRIHLKSAKHD